MTRILREFISAMLIALLFATPSNAMFIQPDWLDPTQPGVGTNRYAYSGNDPVNKIDPNGNFAISLGVAAVVAIVGILGGWAADNMNDYSDDGQCNGSRGLGISAGLMGIFSQSNSNDDSPGMGHNGPPDDDPSQGSPDDPGPDKATTAAISAVVAKQASTKTATAQDVTITEVDGNTVAFSVSTPTGIIDMVAEISVSNGTLSLSNAHIQGRGPNTSSIGQLRSVARGLGRAFGVDKVSITGGMRTSGATSWTFPRYY